MEITACLSLINMAVGWTKIRLLFFCLTIVHLVVNVTLYHPNKCAPYSIGYSALERLELCQGIFSLSPHCIRSRLPSDGHSCHLHLAQSLSPKKVKETKKRYTNEESGIRTHAGLLPSGNVYLICKRCRYLSAKTSKP